MFTISIVTILCFNDFIGLYFCWTWYVVYGPLDGWFQKATGEYELLKVIGFRHTGSWFADGTIPPTNRQMICFDKNGSSLETPNALGGFVLFLILIHGNLHSNYGWWLFKLLVSCWFRILSTPQRSPFIWSSADILNHQRPFGSNWSVMCTLSLWRTINLARVCYSS